MELFEEYLLSKQKYLDEIEPHTEYKIKYIVSYVSKWLEIAVNYKETKTVNFIDCMCNAGIYYNGLLATSAEVLKLFLQFAKMKPYIEFNLFVNDINTNRIEIIGKVFENYFEYKNVKNIKIHFSNEDVNNYIQNLTNQDTYFNWNAKAFTILFVDPYRFGDVKITVLNSFLNKHRAELIFNYFISDYRRNINNETAEEKKKMMIESMNGIEKYNQEMDGDEVLSILQENFIEKTKVEYVFAYPFHIRTNVELYYIIFATPSLKGIELLKKCIWEVFNGNVKHRTKINPEQISLFTIEYEKEINRNDYQQKAEKLLLKKFAGQTVTYKEIEKFVLLNTMLNGSQIINNILKKMVKEKKIEKCNIRGSLNYKNDNFVFKI